MRPPLARVPLIAMFAALCAGCTTPSGQTIDPALLTFDFEVQQGVNPTTRSAAIAGGASVRDFMSPTPCAFTASFDSGGGNVPTVAVSGQPGPGFNVTMTVVTPQNIASRPANCPTVESVALFVGGTGTLNVGGATTQTRLALTIDGETFDTDFEFFGATLEVFRPDTRYAFGGFTFVAASDDDFGTVLIGEGTYGAK